MRSSLLAILLFSLGAIQATANESHTLTARCACRQVEDKALIKIAPSFGMVKTNTSCGQAYSELKQSCNQAAEDYRNACNGIDSSNLDTEKGQDCREALYAKEASCSTAKALEVSSCQSAKEEAKDLAQLHCEKIAAQKNTKDPIALRCSYSVNVKN